MNFNFLLEGDPMNGAWIYIVMIVLIIGMFCFSYIYQNK